MNLKRGAEHQGVSDPTAIGSALNGRGRRLLARLRDPSVTTIVVEHRDRFARLGAEGDSARATQ